MKLSCTRVRDLITPMLDHELAAIEVRAVEDHLQNCTACRGVFEESCAMRDLWIDPPTLDSDPADRAKIVEAARALLEERSGLLPRLWDWLTPTDLVTAGALAASAVFAILLFEGRPTGDLPAGWARSMPAYTTTELGAFEVGTPIEIDDGSETILWS